VLVCGLDSTGSEGDPMSDFFDHGKKNLSLKKSWNVHTPSCMKILPLF
jgi:hypothetical protein